MGFSMFEIGIELNIVINIELNIEINIELGIVSNTRERYNLRKRESIFYCIP